MPGERTTGVLPDLVTLDSVAMMPAATMPVLKFPREAAQGKSRSSSLMQPQDLARRILPAAEYTTLQEFAEDGVPANCGPPWTDAVLTAAKLPEPHVSANWRKILT